LLRYLHLSGYDIIGDGVEDSAWIRRIDIAGHRAAEHAGATLVELAIDELVRLRVVSGQLFFHLALEFLLCHGLSFVQPGCTFEALTIPGTRQFPGLLTSRSASARVLLRAAGARGWTSGSMPSFSIPEISAPKNHQSTHDSA
jgi:hypothetical protein